MAQAPLPAQILDRDWLNINPCVQCSDLSQTDLMAMIAILLAALAGDGDKSVVEQLDESRCNRCISDSTTKILGLIVSILGARLEQDGTITDPTYISDRFKCLRCAPPGDIKAIIIRELVQYLTTRIVL